MGPSTQVASGTFLESCPKGHRGVSAVKFQACPHKGCRRFLNDIMITGLFKKGDLDLESWRVLCVMLLTLLSLFGIACKCLEASLSIATPGTNDRILRLVQHFHTP